MTARLLLSSLALASLALLEPRALFGEEPAKPAAPPPAPIADAPAQIEKLVVEIDAAEKAKDEQAVIAAVRKASPLYRGTQEGGVRLKLAKTLGGVVKNAKLSTLPRKEALKALVETEDGPTAWKALSSAFPPTDSEDAEKFDAEIVKAVGALHPDGAIEVLLETFRKAKMPYLSAAAITALGNYHRSKQREKIALEIAKAGKNMVPSRSSTKNVSQEAQARWGEVAPALGQALDNLFGEKVGDAIEWFKRIDDAKNNLKSLFRD